NIIIMKTKLWMLITFFLCIHLNAQEVTSKSKLFVRVYDLSGNKIHKGKILQNTDNTLVLKSSKGSIEIEIKNVGYIKTKRSPGNNVLVGSIVGATFFGVLGAATAEPDAWILGYSAGEGAATGVLLGGITGAGIGGLSILFKKSKSYIINGDVKRWGEVKDLMLLEK
ncbi:MAG: hypothetical protein OEL54_04555, partial [Flavobacteriaceae bacterium]|nr:hypothetical protein [Flavobacteriaceae bacterium]